MPAHVSKRQFAVWLIVAVVPYEIQRLYVFLAVKSISVVSIGKLSGSESDTVAA